MDANFLISSACHIKDEAVFLELELPGGVKQKKHMKNMKFWTLNPDWKTWLAESFTEAPT